MFKPGDLVMCINVGSIDSRNSSCDKIKLNHFYTVNNYISKTTFGVEQLSLVEIDDVYYNTVRFVKVDRELKLKKILCLE